MKMGWQQIIIIYNIIKLKFLKFKLLFSVIIK